MKILKFYIFFLIFKFFETFDPLPMVFWPPYPWYIDPPTHGILNPLPMVYRPPLHMIFWPPYIFWLEMVGGGSKYHGGSIYHTGGFNIPWM